MARRRILLRVGAGVALIALLLLVRHWMLGGAIPVVRPGQKFKVDPASVR